MGMKRGSIKVYDMTCKSCEKRLERPIIKLEGVSTVKASFSGQFADIEYDDNLYGMNQIKTAIQSSKCSQQGSE